MDKKELYQEILTSIDVGEYTDLFGGSIVFTGLFIIIYTCVIVYLLAYNKIQSLRSNWNNLKCWGYFPLLSWIVDPREGKSMIEHIVDTYRECANEILSDDEIIQKKVRQIKKTRDIIVDRHIKNSEEYKRIQNTIEIEDKASKKYFDDFEGIVKFLGFYGQKFYAGIIDIYRKFIGAVFAVINSVETSYYVIMGGLDTLRNAMAYTRVMMFSFIATKGVWLSVLVGELMVAIVELNFKAMENIAIKTIMTTILIIFGNILAPIGFIFSYILHELTDAIYDSVKSGMGACFAEDTQLELIDGRKVPIQYIHINDVLSDGSVVISTIKVPFHKQRDILVDIDGIIVTKEHKIKHRNEFVEVGTKRDSIKLHDRYDKKWLYCINTNTKQIQIKHHIFLDWDDLDYKERTTIENNMHIIKHKPRFHYDPLYVNLISGFDGNTKVRMKNGSVKYFKELQTGDITENNEVIYGVMTISGKYTHLVETTHSRGIYHTPNIAFSSKIEQKQYDTKMIELRRKKVDVLYHVITNKGSITLHSEKSHIFMDFDETNERILYHRKENRFMSMFGI